MRSAMRDKVSAFWASWADAVPDGKESQMGPRTASRVTFLRGPRPPSVRWEKQRSQSAVANTANIREDSEMETKSKDAAQAQKVVQPRSNCCKPRSVCWSMPMWSRRRIWNGLSRAQTQAVVPPVSAQITSTKGFIEREKKRSHRRCPESRQVHQSFGTRREALRRIAVAGE